jgi:hypothetical protein
MKYDTNMPVAVEWYTNGWIPRRRHVIIVDFGTACKWRRLGADITIQLVDPQLYSDMVEKR